MLVQWPVHPRWLPWIWYLNIFIHRRTLKSPKQRKVSSPWKQDKPTWKLILTTREYERCDLLPTNIKEKIIGRAFQDMDICHGNVGFKFLAFSEGMKSTCWRNHLLNSKNRWLPCVYISSCTNPRNTSIFASFWIYEQASIPQQLVTWNSLKSTS